MTNLLIGGGLALIAAIGILVFWIIAIIKAFQAKETVWGILTILFGIVGLIFFFVKGHTKLGVWNLVFVLLYFVGAGMAGLAVSKDPQLLEQFGGQVPGVEAPAQ
ncbi:MAG: hypothetical protein P1V20_13110 [Verrucomicrobiales bacterium]|nr:hypothetical protein [Verrucomicrobiales bacterium]